MKKMFKRISAIFMIVSFLLLGVKTISLKAEAEDNTATIEETEEMIDSPNVNYLAPATSGVIYEQENLEANGSNIIMPLSVSTKDQYENNNSFEHATILFEYSDGKPDNQLGSLEATLHKDPWYYLFWREIDEDYFRFDILGSADVIINLSNIPIDCNYDIELYIHNNIEYAGFEDVEYVKRSNLDDQSDEEIIITVEPGTYYIRVYSAEGFSADLTYLLSWSISYIDSYSITSISDLRYNKGAKAAVWKSDFDPFNIKPFELEGKMLVGSYMATSGIVSNLYANPIHRLMKERADNGKIVHSVIYIWDLEWRIAIRDKLIEMMTKLDNQIADNKRFTLMINNIVDLANGIINTVDIVALVNSNTIASVVCTIGGYLVSAAELIIPMLFPEKWDTDKETTFNYIHSLIAALEVSSGTSSNEVVALKFRYSYDSNYDGFASMYNYYLNFTPNIMVGETFLYDSPNIPSYNSEAFTYGKVYGMRNLFDLVNFYNGNPETVLQDVNTDEPRIVTLDDSYSGSLNSGQYYWYQFTAPLKGRYTFETHGSTNTFGELFINSVPAQKINGRIKYDNNSGINDNCLLTYEMDIGDTIYIRIRGYGWTQKGSFTFMVTFEDIAIETIYVDNIYSDSLEVNQCHWYQFTALSNGYYIFYTTGNTDTFGALFNSIVLEQSYDGIIAMDDDNGDGKNFKIVYQMIAGSTVYLRINGSSWTRIGDYDLTVELQNEIQIILDPVNMTSVGTEITINGGIRGGTTMTVGYTRNAYIGINAPSTSRLDYNFTSSNTNIATISAYGTITAKSAGVVEIIAIYKQDISYVGKIIVTINHDNTNQLKILNLTTDKRESPKASGTEVTVNGGLPGELTIHKGFTRFICFLGVVPNPIIQDYIFTSSNSTVLSVDVYGTVTAQSTGISVPTLVTITCIYKYNPLFTGTMTFVVYP